MHNSVSWNTDIHACAHTHTQTHTTHPFHTSMNKPWFVESSHSWHGCKYTTCWRVITHHFRFALLSFVFKAFVRSRHFHPWDSQWLLFSHSNNHSWRDIPNSWGNVPNLLPKCWSPTILMYPIFRLFYIHFSSADVQWKLIRKVWGRVRGLLKWIKSMMISETNILPERSKL